MTVPKIESADLTLAQVYKDFYTVPDFQREFVWQPENVERLLQDVLDEFYNEDGQPIDSQDEYFLGSIVTCPAGDGTYTLIDGQQRLTTIYLVLCGIRDELVELDEGIPEVLRGQIRDASLDPKTGEDVTRNRLDLQYEDSAGVLDLIASASQPASSIPETTSSVRNLINAYTTIRDFLNTNFQDSAVQVKKFMAAFTLRVKLIRIVTPSLAHALKVFETINERGVGLNAMDLLKNLLFMSTTSSDFAKLKDRWKKLVDTLDSSREKPLRFLRYYIMAHYVLADWSRPIREDQIYEWFVEHSDECGIKTEPLAFVDRLVECAQAWKNFLRGQGPDGEANRYLENIGCLSGAARQHFILLLAGRHLPTDVFSDLARQIENLFFCYVITRESTKTFERNFGRWSVDLRDVRDRAGLDAFLARYFGPEFAARLNQFRFAVGELSAARIQQYRLRYILAKLTQFIEEQAWGNPKHERLTNYLHGSSVNIEHILSQTPLPEVYAAFDKPDEFDDYRNKLGNLTLLETTLNTAVSNASYAAKVPGYRKSQFLLTKSLAEDPAFGVNNKLRKAVDGLVQFDHWDSQAIDQRQLILGQLAERVWLGDLALKKD